MARALTVAKTEGDIHYESMPQGYRVYRDKVFLVANLVTHQTTGAIKDGSVVWEPMPPESWHIHFTQPDLPVDLVKAVAASLPDVP